MIITKTIDKTASNKVIPLMAALPYKIVLENTESSEENIKYNPILQYTIVAGGDYSTSREDESVGMRFTPASRSDTKKDD